MPSFNCLFTGQHNNNCDELEDDQSDLEDESPGSETNKRKKKPGRKGRWTDDILNDFIDIIASDDYFKKKLIFINTKNQQNGVIYEKILNELKIRCRERGEEFDCTVAQARNKFKKCVSECKKAALTLKTATGIKRFQEDRGYGSWFNQLFQLVKCRDSCQPDQAIEPSTSSTDGASNQDTSDEVGGSSVPKTRKVFVPVKTKKTRYEDVLTSTNELVKKTLENDKTDKMLQLMKDEFEQSRQHELKLFQMLFNSMNNTESQSTPIQGQGQAPMNMAYQPPMVPQPNIWTSGYPGSSNFNQSFVASSHVSQPMPISSVFLSQVTGAAEENLNESFGSGTHYYSL